MGHTISGFSIRDLVDATSDDYVGMFAIVGPAAIVRNLTVNGNASTAIGTRLGLHAGRNRGTLVNVHTSGGVGAEENLGSVMGGLVSRNDGTIQRSSAAWA
jgi:hypothetical protein